VRKQTIGKWTAVVAALALAPVAGAGEARYLETEVTLDGAGNAVVRSAFEIGCGPHEWYGVWQQFRLDGATPLKTADGKEILKKWGDLFTPANIDRPRWTDCRGGFSFAELSAAANLPRGKRTVLWATTLLADTVKNAWIDSGGWNVRAALIVTADAEGKITKAETFAAPPLAPDENHATEKVAAKECSLSLKELKLKGDAGLYRIVGLRHETHDTLVSGAGQAALTSRDRGAFFEAIDAPGKAIELAQIAYPRAAIIRTPQQYRAIIEALKKIPGWEPSRFLVIEEPAAFGVTAAEEPGLGWRVKMLIIPHNPYLRLGLRDVCQIECTVSPDGRLGEGTTVCIAAPMTPYGAPPGWEPEFGGGAGEKSLRNPEAAILAWNGALRAALTGEGSHALPGFVEVKDKRTTIPCAAKTEARWYLNDIDNWPEDASK
jgi:hypothetical protein